MKSLYEGRYKNIFWLRPAFRNSQPFMRKVQGQWLSLKKTASSTTGLLLLFLFFLAIFACLFLACWVDHSINSGNSILFFKRTQNTTAPDYPLDCPTWNQTQTCPNGYPTTFTALQKNRDGSPEPTCPDYFRWIHEDLRHWRETGITKEMLDKGIGGANFRLVILDGRLYVEKFRKALQTRDLFTLWGFVQLVRWYPGRVPDLELLFNCDDRPVVPMKQYRQPNSGPPPIFKYCSDWQSMDIVFPDWSFWGWAETNIKPWHLVLKDIKEGNKRVKWKDRVPYAYWRGNPHVAPTRGDLVSCNVSPQNDWNTRLFFQDWANESKQAYKHSNLEDQCTYRFKIYIEGWAWSVSEKYILACDSPTLYVTPRYYTFFARGMVPLKHFWPIRDNDKCKSLKYAVDWGNNHTIEAQEIGKASSRYVQEDMKMEYVYDYMLHSLTAYAKLLKFKPTVPPKAMELCSETMACFADSNWKKFMDLSLVRSPSNTMPCTMPPPYEPAVLRAFYDEKGKAIRQVETWEDEFWKNRNGKQ